MLGLSQTGLADAASVSRASVFRYESGKPIGAGQVRLLILALEQAGIVLIPDGTVVNGIMVFDGVGLREAAPARLPHTSRAPDVS